MAGLAQAGEALTASVEVSPGPRTLARRLWHQPSGRAGLIILAVMVLAGLASLAGLTPYAPDAQNPLVTLHGPAAAHLFGTDQFGRDVLSRVMAGTLLSLQTALLAVAICAVVGTLGGVAAGYFGGAVSWVVTSLADLIFAVPSVLLALAIVSGLGPGWQNTAIAVGISYTPIFIRVVRGPVLTIRQAEYVKAARVLGFSRSRILFRHVLPGVGGVLAVQVTLALGWAVLIEASLDFLGLGPPPPAATLGLMVSEGTNIAGIAWWNLAFPAIAVVLLVLGFTLTGDGLRDALDPSGSGRLWLRRCSRSGTCPSGCGPRRGRRRWSAKSAWRSGRASGSGWWARAARASR